MNTRIPCLDQCFIEYFHSIFFPQITGDTKFADVPIESIKLQCENEIYRNESLWEKSKDGGFVLPSAIVHVNCPLECSNRGECVKGMTLS